MPIVDNINEFLRTYPYVGIIIDSIFALFIISLIIFFALRLKKARHLIIIGLIMLSIKILSNLFGLQISTTLYTVALSSYIVITVAILVPDIRMIMEFQKDRDSEKKEKIYSTTQNTKEAIVDAVFSMSASKVGALITIEQHISLEQYAERAIPMNSDVSKELLEQIFIKDSPLHDGGVIIRGNKILCAAAYYSLTQKYDLDKTMGSRHRAGIGLSEFTDSITIIVSEETGAVHVAISGIMKVMNSAIELLEYLDLGLGKN